MSDVEIKSITSTKITPELLAKSFWNMADEQQAEFFKCLYDEVILDMNGGLGEMQWLAMTNAISKNSIEAKKMFLAFSCFAYDYVSQKYDI